MWFLLGGVPLPLVACDRLCYFIVALCLPYNYSTVNKENLEKSEFDEGY